MSLTAYVLLGKRDVHFTYVVLRREIAYYTYVNLSNGGWFLLSKGSRRHRVAQVEVAPQQAHSHSLARRSKENN